MASHPVEVSVEELEVLLVMRSGSTAGRAVHNYARRYTDERANFQHSDPYTRG